MPSSCPATPFTPIQAHPMSIPKRLSLGNLPYPLGDPFGYWYSAQVRYYSCFAIRIYSTEYGNQVKLVPGITRGTPKIDSALYQGYLVKTRPDLQQPPPTALYRSPLTTRYHFNLRLPPRTSHLLTDQTLPSSILLVDSPPDKILSPSPMKMLQT